MAVTVVERFKQESIYRLSEKVVVTERCRCGAVALSGVSDCIFNLMLSKVKLLKSKFELVSRRFLSDCLPTCPGHPAISPSRLVTNKRLYALLSGKPYDSTDTSRSASLITKVSSHGNIYHSSRFVIVMNLVAGDKWSEPAILISRPTFFKRWIALSIG